MNNLIKLGAAVALAISTVAVSAAAAPRTPTFMPFGPVAMSAADQEKMDAQHQAFVEQRAAAMQQAMEARRRFVDRMFAEQQRQMDVRRAAMDKFFEERMTPREPFAGAMPEMPGMPGSFAMSEMPAPMAMTDRPRPPAFDNYYSMDPQARREAMSKYRNEMRQAMQQRHQEMRKQMAERRDQMRKEMQERRDAVAKDRPGYMGRDA